MKNRTTAVFIALMLVFSTLACTLPFYVATSPESDVKIVYVEITSTPEEDADSDDEDETTPPIPVNLDGPWTIWQGSAEQKLTIDFLHLSLFRHLQRVIDLYSKIAYCTF